MRAVEEARREEARGVEPLEAREESSRGGARGEQSCSSSSVQAHSIAMMATAQHDGNTIAIQHGSAAGDDSRRRRVQQQGDGGTAGGDGYARD